jgi:hypothetical protein
MSWHFSRALVAEYSAACSWGGAPYAPLNSIPTHGMFWLHAKTIGVSPPSRSGMTYEPSMGDPGRDLLMWCRADSRAKTSAPQVRAQELPEPKADSGQRWRELLVKYDPNTHGWKTLQCLWEEVSEWSSLTLPRWGSMRNGELWELMMPERPIDVTESGYWPTIRSTDGERGGRGDLIQAVRGNENTHFKMWMTPSVSVAEHPGQKAWKPHQQLRLNQQVNNPALWPTPNTVDAKGGTRKGEGQTQLCHTVGGSLNPTWVEWLMGWPLGWTDCAVSATDRFRQWFDSHTGS